MKREYLKRKRIIYRKKLLKQQKEIPETLREEYDDKIVEYLLTEINNPYCSVSSIPKKEIYLEKENEFEKEKERMKEIEKDWEQSSIQTKREYFILKRTVYRTLYIKEGKQIPQELEEKYDDYNIHYLLKENHLPIVSQYIIPSSEEEFTAFINKQQEKKKRPEKKISEIKELEQFDQNNQDNENNEIEKKSLSQFIEQWEQLPLEERKEYFIRKRNAMRNQLKSEEKEIPEGLEEKYDEFNLCYLLQFNKSPFTKQLFIPSDEKVLKYDKYQSVFNSTKRYSIEIKERNERNKQEMMKQIKEGEEQIELLKKQTKQYEKEREVFVKEKEEMENKIEEMKKEKEEIEQEKEKLRKEKEEINAMIKKFDEIMLKQQIEQNKQKENEMKTQNGITKQIQLFTSIGNQHQRSISQGRRNDSIISMKQNGNRRQVKDSNDISSNSNGNDTQIGNGIIERSKTPRYHSRGCSVSNVSMINGRIQVISGLNSLNRNSTRMVEDIKLVDEK